MKETIGIQERADASDFALILIENILKRYKGIMVPTDFLEFPILIVNKFEI